MGFLSKPKIEAQPALPPAATPPVFANVYSRVAAERSVKKKKPATPKDAGFGDDGGQTQRAALAAATPTATPSLLG